MTLPWLRVWRKQGPSFGTLFKRTLGRGPEYNEPWHMPWTDNRQENSAWNCWKDESWQHHTVLWLAACAEIWLRTPHSHPSPLQWLHRQVIINDSDGEETFFTWIQRTWCATVLCLCRAVGQSPMLTVARVAFSWAHWCLLITAAEMGLS